MRGTGLLVLILLAGLTGCSPQSSSNNDTKDGVEYDWSYKAEVNYETGEIVLPVEKYYLSSDDLGDVFGARTHFMIQCQNAKGIDIPWRLPSGSTDLEDRRFGFWLLRNAETFGFTLPRSPEDVATLEADAKWAESHVNDQAWQDAANEATAECGKESQAEELDLANIPAPPAFDLGVLDLALESAEAKTVFADWEKCLNDNGLERDLDMSLFAVKGVSYEVADEQSIKAAVINAQCKADTDYTQRMADIMAAAQGPFVKKHEAELQEYYDAQLVVLGKARDYLAKNVPEWYEVRQAGVAARQNGASK